MSALPGFAPALRIHALGGLTLSLDGQPVTGLASRRTEALLVYLICARGPVSREALADLLWDERGQTQAAGNLRVVINSLRRNLAPFVEIDRYSIGFNFASDYAFDAADFEATVRAAMPGSRQPDIELLFRAAGMYRGEFLAGFGLHDCRRFEEWSLLERERLQRQMVETLDALVEGAARARRHRAGIDLATRLLRIDPLRETTHRHLMRFHARAGERSAALAQYQACERILRTELDVEPAPETKALAERIRAADAPWTIAAPLTPFVGRQAELARISAHLADPDCRLLTLAGPGGSGKTRLAIEAARAITADFLNGAVLVPLAEARTGDALIIALASALEAPLAARGDPRAQLRAWLRDRELLVVLDNAEQLAGAAGDIVALLEAAPDLKILLTSRQRLDLRAEWLIDVGGLNDADAEALFAQSAARAHPDLRVDQAGAVRICRLVDGMPLAIELAAALAGELPCAAIADQIAESLDFLETTRRDIPDRQRSLRVVFDRSWELLGLPEQEALARLSVFSGGFDPEAARQVAGADRRALAALAGQSLLRRVGPDRFDLHALIRQYAAERLKCRADPGAAHAAYYGGVLRRQEHALKGAGQAEALRLLDLEIANIRAAWAWGGAAFGARPAEAASFFSDAMEALTTFYWLRSWFHEGAAAFERAVSAVEAFAVGNAAAMDAGMARLLGGLLARQARLCEFTSVSSDTPVDLYQRSLALLREVKLESETALPLFGLAYMAHMRGQFEQARMDYEASLRLYLASGDAWGAANTLSNLCLTLRRQGCFDEAIQRGLASLALRREIGDRRGIASSQNNLALVYTATGDYAAAGASLEESVAICREIGHTVGVANALTTQVQVAHALNDRDRAIRHQREALDLYRIVGDGWGVAVAHNNLGQMALEGGDLNEAGAHFQESVARYRQMGMLTGLANTLSNVGQIAFLRGDHAAAARYWRESLTIARDNGDVPIGLEILTRVAAMWLSRGPEAPPGVALRSAAFALTQPALLAETRASAAALYTRLTERQAPEAVAAVEDEAAARNFASVADEALEHLRREG